MKSMGKSPWQRRRNRERRGMSTWDMPGVTGVEMDIGRRISMSMGMEDHGDTRDMEVRWEDGK